ncbi:hypothetical protein OROMI_010270 [Orobanche minor]
MYMSEKTQQQQESAIDFYTSKQEQTHQISNMIIQLPPQPQLQHLPDGAATTPSGGEDGGFNRNANQNSSNPPSSSGPKKRAETWVQEETRALISLRKETDMLFNTSKSNKHLWDNISLKMRGKGFDRSPAMCTDKWRNLLKEFKKAKQNNSDNGNGYAKMSYYKEIGDILSERNKSSPTWKNSELPNNSGGSKVDSFMQFADKGIDDASLPFGPVEGEQTNNMYGRVITVKLGDYTKRIGIDASGDAIEKAIKSAFRLRTKRAFWLEDEDNVVRSLDRDMPLGNYTLHVDEGLTIKVCVYEETDPLPVHTVDKTFYSDEDFHDFLSRRGWTCLREYNGFRNVDSVDDLCPGAIYRGVN